MSGDADLAEWIDKLNGLSATVYDDAAKASQPLVYEAAKSTAAAGVSPNTGEPWRLRKDGQRAIPNAASNVKVNSSGSTISIKVTGGTAIQNYISEKNRRQVIPDKGKPIPKSIIAAIQAGCAVTFKKAMG